MSDLLQEIKDYLDSIRHNAANAALAKNVNEYGVCVKIVSDCEEAVLSLFRKLDREYWELLERFGQLQAKVERYEKALEFYADEETYETKFATDTDEIFDPFTLIELDGGKKAREALGGESNGLE